MSVIASSASNTSPMSGHNHRSGFNFQLLSNNGSAVAISSPDGVVFDIKHAVFGINKVVVPSVTNGTVIPGGVLKTGEDYYIASPKHARDSFAVTLTQR